MWKKNFKLFICILPAIILFAFTMYDYNCIDINISTYEYENIPFPTDVQNHPEIDNTPIDNPITNSGATLGRVLFYDVDLSQNRTIACASCHQQEFAFSDSARFSIGFDGSKGSRNSMSLMHVRFQKDNHFFWDGRASSVEEQVIMPFQNPIEMGMTMPEVIARIKEKSIYQPLFKAAFGSEEVSTEKISKALAQFVRSINTFDSKFRKGISATQGNPSTTPFINFTAEENLGKDLFMDVNRGNCQACHTKNLMVPEGAQNIGLDVNYTDNGFGSVTGNPNSSQNGKFKVPSLINVALTAPYMHDGRFTTLEQVVDFYSDSIKAHANLSGFLREIEPGNPSPNNNPCMTCPPRKPHFTVQEKKALVAFLKTLTDVSATTDPRWSNPFCKSIAGTKELTPVLSSTLYPNPIKSGNKIQLRLINGQNFMGSIKIINSLGQIVQEIKTEITIGKQEIEIENQLHTGVYYVIIEKENKNIFTTKLNVL